MNAIQTQLLLATSETQAHGEQADGASARSAGAPSAVLYQRVTSGTKRNFPQLRFLTLDRDWQRRLRCATKPETVAALRKEKEARRLCLTRGYCVAYYTHDRKFFTWHFYASKADVLAHVDYLNFVFRAQGECLRIAKLRLPGRSWTAAEKLAFEGRAYGV